jgi:GDP-4-dehydro-6-deoxy-D-mannose reductase
MASSVLVTGAAGFVGSHLLELLRQDGAEIVAWQRPGTEPLLHIDGVHWDVVEMHDRANVLAAIKDANPSSVYHLAGVPHVGDSWQHTRETFAGNVLATNHLFEGLRRSGLAPRVLITSSATVYTPANRALREDDAVCPNNPYGTSKLAQEMVGMRAWEDDGIPGLIARAFNHVGPRQAPAFLAPSLAKQIAEIEAGGREPVLKVGNLAPRRDIMDVRDTVRAYRAMMQSATPGLPYNVCSGRAIAVKDLLDQFVSRAKVAIRVEQDPARFRPNDTPLLLGDRTRLETDTGWSPRIPLSQTVDDLLNYWRMALTGRT